MSNMDSHGIPDVKKVVEDLCRELTRRAEADSTTPADKSPVSTTPADKSPVSTTPPVMAAPVMAAPTSSDEKEKEADTARLGRGHRVKKTKRRFDEEDSTGAGGREEAAKADDAAPTSSEDGKVATDEDGKVASDEDGKVASDEDGKVASDEDGKVATDEDGKVASDEDGKVASDEVGKVASDEDGKVATGGGSRAEDVVKAELSSLPTTPQGSRILAFDRSKWKQMNQGRNLTMYCIQICLFDESLHHMYTLFPFRVAVFSNQPAEPDPVPHRLRCCWDPDPVPHRRSLRCHPNPSRNHPPRRRLRRPPGSTSPCVL